VWDTAEAKRLLLAMDSRVISSNVPYSHKISLLPDIYIASGSSFRLAICPAADCPVLPFVGSYEFGCSQHFAVDGFAE
jgi:hypothetical protein